MSYLSRLSSPRLRRLLLASVVSVPLGFACSSDDAAPEAPLTFTLEIARVEGAPLGDEPVALHCDGTLAVEVALTTEPTADAFIWRPSQACGGSSRCGYVRIAGLSADGEELAHVDSATPVALLRLQDDQLARLAKLTAQLIHGTDDTPLLNPDQSEVTASAAPGFQVPSDCPEPLGEGGAGAGGAAPGSGGAGGASSGAEGGAPVVGGAPGAGGSAEGGSPAAGAPSTDPSAGAGGS